MSFLFLVVVKIFISILSVACFCLPLRRFNNNLIVFMSLKKMSLLFVLPALVCACSSDEETLPKVAEAGENEVSTFRLSPQEAASAVSDFLSDNRRKEFVEPL